MNSVQINTCFPDNPQVTVETDSELMRNFQSALPVSPLAELAAVHDAKGRPIVFNFSPDGGFYVIHHAEDHATGWTQVNLSTGLAAYGKPKSFGVNQLADGSIMLVAAVQDISDASTEHLFLAGPLSADLSQTNWNKLDDIWIKSSNPHAGTTVDDIFVGPIDNGQGYGLSNIAVSLKDDNADDTTNYILQANIDESNSVISWKWLDFPTPTTKVKMLDFALGNIYGLGQGVYMLYEGEGDAPWLVFKTFLNQYDRSFIRTFEVPEGAATLQSTHGNGHTTGLYVGGSGGIFYFSPGNQNKGAIAKQIATAAQVPDIRPGGLMVREDQIHDGTIAVWALSGENLYYFYNKQPESGGAWSIPFLFQSGVTKVAPLRNALRYANELIYIGTDLQSSHELHYMWQDPGTTLWTRDHISLEATDKVLELQCYTTHISLLLPGGSGLVNQKVSVSSADWQRLIINGVTHVVDQDSPVEVHSDVQGHITVINKVNSLAATKLYLQAEWFAGTIEIDPDNKVHSQLTEVSSPADIPVLPAKLPFNVSKQEVADSVNGLMQFHPASGETVEAIRYWPTGLSGKANTLYRAGQNGKSFGLEFKRGSEAARVAAAANFSAKSIFGSVAEEAGNVIQWIKTSIDEIEHFFVKVVDGAVHFVAKVGEEVKSFLVETFPALYDALSWVFDKVKVLFTDLIQWLGKLFGWDDIWATHKVIANMMTSCVDFAVDKVDAELGSWEKEITDFFDQIEHQIEDRVLPPEITKRTVRGDSKQVSAEYPGANFKTPHSNWVFYQLSHGGLLEGSSPSFTNNPFMQFVQDVIEPTVNDLYNDIKDDIQDIMRILQGEGSTYADYARLIVDLAKTALDPIRDIVVGVLKFIKDLVNDVKGAIEDPLDIPFLSAFYRWVTGILGESEELSVINGMALLVAIPYTGICKAVTGKAPFAEGTYGLESPDLFYQLQPESAGPPPMPAMAMASAPMVLAEFGEPAGTAVLNLAAMEGSAPSKLAHQYSCYGGGIGAIAGFASNITKLIGFSFSEAGNPGGGASSTKEANAGWVAFGFDLICLAGTFPMPDDKLRGTPFTIKIVDWCLAGLSALLGKFIPSATVGAGITIGIDLVIGVSGVVADALYSADGWTWLNDVASNLGGVVENAGLIAFKYGGEEVAWAPVILGMAVAYLGGTIPALIHSLTAVDGELIRVVNVGG